jgi:hypothetical protein
MENQKKLNTRRLNDSIAIRPPMAIVAVDGLVEAARRIGLNCAWAIVMLPARRALAKRATGLRILKIGHISWRRF